MYVPPFDSLLRSIGTNKESLETAAEVTIPVGLLKLLLQLAVAHSDFDEQAYLSANPDVRQAVHRGDVESGQMHYIGYGYFEGRRGGTIRIDERRYLRDNPDVAAAIREGKISSGEAHFYMIGAGEGRSPSPDQSADTAEWKRALHAR
jgi:hypothetical protein